MIYINETRLMGYVGKDPEFRVTQSNATQCARFTIATTKRITRQDGTTEDRTQWHNVVLWGKTAEIAKRAGLVKGSLVYVFGETETRQWTDQMGEKHYITEVRGTTIQVFPKASQNSQGTAQGAAQPTEQQGYQEGDDDLPF